VSHNFVSNGRVCMGFEEGSGVHVAAVSEEDLAATGVLRKEGSDIIDLGACERKCVRYSQNEYNKNKKKQGMRK